MMSRGFCTFKPQQSKTSLSEKPATLAAEASLLAPRKRHITVLQIVSSTRQTCIFRVTSATIPIRQTITNGRSKRRAASKFLHGHQVFFFGFKLVIEILKRGMQRNIRTHAR